MGIFGIISTYLRHRSAWEDVCSQCGLCCYERTVYSDGEMDVDLTAPCKYLDQSSHRCMVYGNRFRVCDDCQKVTLRKALSKTYMPACCAYRQLFE